jgi:hypothetical protein
MGSMLGYDVHDWKFSGYSFFHFTVFMPDASEDSFKMSIVIYTLLCLHTILSLSTL